MKYNSYQYSSRVWLTSVIVAPAFFNIIQYGTQSEYIHNWTITSILSMYSVWVLLEFIFSSVIWLIFWGIIALIAWYFEDKTGTIMWLVFVAGMLLAIAPFALFCFLSDGGGDYNDPFFPEIAISNCACIA